MITLLDLPYEVLNYILKQVNPCDLAPLSRCCKDMHRIINENPLLFKQIYLSKFDEPPGKRNPRSSQWQKDVQKFVKFEKILESDDENMKRQHLQFVVDCVSDLHRVASSANDETSLNQLFLRRLFSSPSNLATFMCGSSLFLRARGGTPTPTLRSNTARHQLTAKLHCLYGSPIENTKVTDSEEIYPYACSRVYDLRNYTQLTHWGPFMDDGSDEVDWEMMESIMVVLAHNLRQCRVFSNPLIKPLWSRPFAGMVPHSHILTPPPEPMLAPPSAESSGCDHSSAACTMSPSPKDRDALPLPDPYGITGTWMRVVCFLDYTELFAYNFTSASVLPEQPRDPLDTEEAIRMIVMHVTVQRIEDPGEFEHPDYPVVHFFGTSRPRYAYWDPNATANVRGSVRMTREGEVRWTTFSIYHGEERWRSEGVQIGGVRSARGVVGNWFDKDYDTHGPAGPTAFWKISGSPEGDAAGDAAGEEDEGAPTDLHMPGQ